MSTGQNNSEEELRQSIARFAFDSRKSSLGAGPRRSPRTFASPARLCAKSEDLSVAICPPSTSPSKRPRSQSLESVVEHKTKSPKKKRGYAAPEVYAHLNVVQDYVKEDLDVMFCGINPGFLSATSGHHFASPSNHFYRCLHRSGFTDRLIPPLEDYTLPDVFNLGLTNLVDRPSREEAELSKDEMVAGVPALMSKISAYRPRLVCFVGRGIWNSVEKALTTKFGVKQPRITSTRRTSPISPRKAGNTLATTWRYGLQPYVFHHYGTDADALAGRVASTMFFVTPSTSGRVTSHQLPDKVKLFEELRLRVKEHRDRTIGMSAMLDITAI